MCQGSYDRRERILQRSTSQGSIGSPVYNRHGYTPTLSRSPQHFHRPGEYVDVPVWARVYCCIVCNQIKCDFKVFIGLIDEIFTGQVVKTLDEFTDPPL